MAAAVSVETIRHFHAHIYFNEMNRDIAWGLRERIGQAFDVAVGHFHEKPVGPHTAAMFQVAFSPDQFGEIVPWLALNRQGLSILVHPGTGDSVADHTLHAVWMGTPLPVNVEPLRKG